MTALTSLYQLPYLEPGQPLRDTRAVMEAQTKRLEEVLSARGVPIPAGDIAALRADVTALQAKTTVVPATAAAMPYQKSQVDTLLGSTANIDELFTSTVLGDFTAPASFNVFVAPFPLRIAGVSFAMQAAVASSTTASYLAELRRTRAGTATTFATKTTNSADGAGGQAIAANVDWNFDAIPFTAATASFVKGDLMTFRMAVAAGAPTPTTIPRAVVTVRYVPL